MIVSLKKASTGLTAQSIRMDIVGNNVANINSTGFKKSSAVFEDLLYQEVNRLGLPVGENVFAGSGVRISETKKDFRQGALMETGRNLDFAIDGNGFFAVELPNGEIAFTRDGSFSVDREGFLVTGGGLRVFPYVQVPENWNSIRVNSTGEVIVVYEDGITEELGILTIFDVPNPGGMISLGRGLYSPSDASGEPIEGVPGADGFGVVKQGFLEMSNVDLGEEMTEMILAQRSFQLNAKLIHTFDEMWYLANSIRG
ncbi:MAG: Flagellar basal-body rod protein FlgG [Clostridia bacterium 41_269]|nr:MAG: Flagellar basal-body rod protein FlgG [Clostridia bacterium 41_269]